MDEKLAIVRGQLGAEGINAFYVYLFLYYAGLWVLIGLCVWGARTVWNRIKDDL